MMRYVQQWMDALTRPAAVLPAEKSGAKLAEGVKHVALVSAIAGLLFGLLYAFTGAMFVFAPGANYLFGLGLASIVAAPILFVVFGVVGGLALNAIAYGVNKALGGTGTFEEQFYLTALWGPALALVQMVVNILPFVGWILVLLIDLYALYLLWMTFKVAHGLDSVKAIAGIVGVMVVWAVLTLLLRTVLPLGVFAAPLPF